MPLRGFPRNTFPTVLPSQSKGLHRASFPGLVWYARMRYYGQGDSATNAAASSWDAPSIAFGTFTSFAAWACRTPPSPHESTRQNAPLLTCTTCPRHPAQRACLKNLNGSFGPLPPRALWRPVETEHSPDSGGPISPRLGRAAAELDHPQGWQLSSSMWLHTQKELGSPRLAFRVRYISPSPGFTSDSLLYTSHPLNTHL